MYLLVSHFLGKKKKTESQLLDKVKLNQIKNKHTINYNIDLH